MRSCLEKLVHVAGGIGYRLLTRRAVQRRPQQSTSYFDPAWFAVPALLLSVAPAETSVALPDCPALRCKDSPPKHAHHVSPRPPPNRADFFSNGRAAPGLRRHASKA